MKQHTVQIDFALHVDVSPAELEVAILKALHTPQFGYPGEATVRHVNVSAPMPVGVTGVVADPPKGLNPEPVNGPAGPGAGA